MVRAKYHFQPRENWMNDPNGPIFIDGKLHMFYQHNPSAPVWGNMTWGHAVSHNITHWSHMPHALAPTPNGPDNAGVFSGCAVMHQGRPHLLYTGVTPEVLCLAIGDELGINYEKHVDNPLLSVDNSAYTGWRDPFVWKENGEYRMIIGSGIKDVGGVAMLYKSADLKVWEAMGELCRGEVATAGDMWECPNFLTSGEDAALIVSALPQTEVLCIEGKYVDGTMKLGKPFRYDIGDSFYAPNTVTTDEGRYLQWGWMREAGDPEQRNAQGWQGMFTLPREVRLSKGGVRVKPAREVTQLRKELLFEKRNFTVRTGDNILKNITGQHLEIEVSFEPGANRLVTELLRAGQDACARITYDGASDWLEADLTSLSGGEHRIIGGGVQHEPNVTITMFLDGTAIECFINNRETMTTRAYPTQGCDGLRMYGEAAVRIHSLKVYAMGSAYADENLPVEESIA